MLDHSHAQYFFIALYSFLHSVWYPPTRALPECIHARMYRTVYFHSGLRFYSYVILFSDSAETVANPSYNVGFFIKYVFFRELWWLLGVIISRASQLPQQSNHYLFVPFIDIERKFEISTSASMRAFVSLRILARDFKFLNSPKPNSNPINPPDTNAPIIQADTGCAWSCHEPTLMVTGIEL